MAHNRWNDLSWSHRAIGNRRQLVRLPILNTVTTVQVNQAPIKQKTNVVLLVANLSPFG
jgi:hypothetical protein